MAKSIKQMGWEALCWKIVEAEMALHVCGRFREAMLQTVREVPLESEDVSMAIMQAIDQAEGKQHERMYRLQLEQARRERAMGLPLCQRHIWYDVSNLMVERAQ